MVRAITAGPSRPPAANISAVRSHTMAIAVTAVCRWGTAGGDAGPGWRSSCLEGSGPSFSFSIRRALRKGEDRRSHPITFTVRSSLGILRPSIEHTGCATSFVGACVVLVSVLVA